MTMDLEDLTYVRVSTLGRTENTTVDYPAATTVLSSEDIRRSHATTIPEALRNVPGMQVASINAFDHSISVRGFNDNNSNKLLVLADGRSLRDGTFSGTSWGSHDMILGDLERIEVLRGPGASLWGANAMNGFINIVSKSAFDTQGGYFSAGGGNLIDHLAELRHGWKLNSQTAARVYAKSIRHDGDVGGLKAGVDNWETLLVGTRVDSQFESGSELTVIAEARDISREGLFFRPTLIPPFQQLLPEKQDARHFNLSARWSQPVEFWDSTFTAFTAAERIEDNREAYDEQRVRYVLDLQAKMHPWQGHELLAGLTYEQTDDELEASTIFSIADPAKSISFFGAFLQDEFEPVRDRLRITIGAKIERNPFSGWEFQPSARAIWSPAKAHRIWGAIAHAARTPTRIETGLDYFAQALIPATPNPFLPPNTPIALVIKGSPDLGAEQLTAFDFGYRYSPTPKLVFELNGFYNNYEDLRGFTAGIPDVKFIPVLHVEVPTALDNSLQGHSHGGEATLRWQATSEWLLELSHSHITHDLESVRGPTDLTNQNAIDLYAGATPRNESKLHVSWRPQENFNINLSLRHAGAMIIDPIPAYTALDVGIRWQPVADWEVSLIGRNLLESQHREFPEIVSRDVQPNIGRSLFLRISTRF